MLRLTRGMKGLICALCVGGLAAWAQQNAPDGPKPKDQPQQTVPHQRQRLHRKDNVQGRKVT
jgi:hypothetical protein